MKIHINARAGLGDTVYFISIVQTLFKHIQNLKISIICWNAGVELYSSIHQNIKIINANEFISFMSNANWDEASPKAKSFFNDTIGQSDFYIDLQPLPNYKKETLSVNTKSKIAINPHPDMRCLYDKTISSANGEHILSTYRKMLTSIFNIDDCIEPGNYQGTDEMKTKIDKIISLIKKDKKSPLLCIHPGAKKLDKLWTVLKWGRLINYLIDNYNFKAILIGSSLRFTGKTPILDIPSCDAIQRLTFDRAFNLAGQTNNILLLTELIRKCSLYIGLDTGPTHIASTSGIPTFELFKKESEEQFNTWKAWGKNVTIYDVDDMDDIFTEQAVKKLENWNVFQQLLKKYS
ncbi:glycosyltransferase family 9 protein [bacterium]|nr:glycosyltransferase family 9 protein [bacterium]